MRKACLIFCLLLSLSGLAFAEEDAFERLMAAKCLRCEFSRRSQDNWKGGKLKVELSEWGADSTHFIDSINLKTGKARIIGNQGAIDVLVVTTIGGLTFVEKTGFGNLVFRTVFFKCAEGGTDFIAVMSRHMVLPGGMDQDVTISNASLLIQTQ